MSMHLAPWQVFLEESSRLWLVFYFFGNKIRHVSWEWGFIKKLAHWHEDREVGE